MLLRAVGTILCAVALSTATTAHAQTLGAEIKAIAGQPFGIAEVTVPYPVPDMGLFAGRPVVTVDGPAGRVHYPAVTDGVVRRLLSNGPRRRSSVTVMFLFTGSEPLDVQIQTPSVQTIHIEPEAGSGAAHRRLLRRWWRGYSNLFHELEKQNEHPPVLETYLTSMLARRLGLTETLVERFQEDLREDEPGDSALELLAGAESTRNQILRGLCLGMLDDTGAPEVSLPASPVAAAGRWPAPQQEVEIESLARRVPAECFYVRFGQFENFFWFNTLMEDYGGDVGSMVTARGYRAELRERIQTQLAMEQGMLAELLGPQAISDVAVIGLDTFTRDGAAMGFLFETRGPLFALDLARQRSEALKRETPHGATVTQVKFGEHTVALLSTPDNRLRSYHAIDGKYHLVTNSSTLVRRFYELAGSGGSLGDSPEFQHARSVVPVSRGDTIFVYFSSAFFQNLLSPHCQVELRRRLRAATECQLLSLASLAAQAEGVPGQSLSDLVAAGLLPAEFAQRPDGSHPELRDERVVDSLRGARGYFTPVPDMAIDSVTRTERDRCLQQTQYYAEHSQHFDPILVALRREVLEEEGRERMKVEAFVTPMGGFKLRVLVSLLGEPSSYKFVPPQDCLLSVDASVRGGTVLQSVPPHRLFVALLDREVRDQPAPSQVLRLLSIVRTAPGLLGAWPKPGFLDFVPLISGAGDEEGFSQLPLSVLRWQGRGFSVLSLDQQLLEQASREIGFVDEGSPAHVRIHAGNLSRAKFAPWLHQIAYQRARQVSVGNVRLISALHQQLRVPLERSQQTMEELLDAKLICALGGAYEVVEQGHGTMVRSTAWPDQATDAAPDDYVAAPLQWFRGLEARLVLHGDRLVLNGYVDMQRKKSKPALSLPSFSLPGTR